MHEFKWRHYDAAIGRFATVDPLAEDYVHNSTYAFAENKVISHLELEGLEGVHSSKVDGAGIRTHVIQKNVIVLTQAPRPIEEDASANKAKRIERQNARIEKRNENKIERTEKSLNRTYANAKNTDGESVTFDFNVTGMEGSDLEQGVRGTNSIAEENGITTSDGKIAKAAIIGIGESEDGTAGTTGGDFFVKLSQFSAIGHEIGHTLLTRKTGVVGPDGDHSNVGLMTVKHNDATKLTPTEVDKMIEDAYEN